MATWLYLGEIFEAIRNLKMDSTSFKKRISKIPKAAYYYALSYEERWPEGEEVLSKDPQFGIDYACNIIQGRWKELEEGLSKRFGEKDLGDTEGIEDYLSYLDHDPWLDESEYPSWVIGYLKRERGTCSNCGGLLPKRDVYTLEEDPTESQYCSEQCADTAYWDQEKHSLESYIEDNYGNSIKDLKEAQEYVLSNWEGNWRDIETLLEKGGYL